MMLKVRHIALRVPFVSRALLATGGAIAAAAIAVALESPLVALAALAIAWGAGSKLRAREATRVEESVPVRLGGVALGASSSIHAVRFDGRVLLVGVTPSHITILGERADGSVSREVATEASEREAGRCAAAHVRRVVPPLFLCLLLPLASALAAQTESGKQRVDFEAKGAERSSGREGVMAPEGPLAPGIALPPASFPSRASRDAAPGGSIVWIAALALLPFAVMGATSFVKVSVVLSFLRSALGTPQTPSDPVLAAIALSVTFFVMSPTLAEAIDRAKLRDADVTSAAGALAVVADAVEPFRAFLARNSRPEEVALFVELSGRGGRPAAAPGELAILLPAFVTSQLREAFVAGFLLFVPFLVVDMVVANVLMSMGMVMVSPAMVSLPLKILLFVLADGWPLLLKALALGYQ